MPFAIRYGRHQKSMLKPREHFMHIYRIINSFEMMMMMERLHLLRFDDKRTKKKKKKLKRIWFFNYRPSMENCIFFFFFFLFLFIIVSQFNFRSDIMFPFVAAMRFFLLCHLLREIDCAWIESVIRWKRENPLRTSNKNQLICNRINGELLPRISSDRSGNIKHIFGNIFGFIVHIPPT